MAMLVGRSSVVAPTKWSRKPGPISVPKAVSSELDDAFDEVDGGDAVLAVGAEVVADHEGAVGPADEDGPVEVRAASMMAATSSAQQRAVGVVLGGERRLGHAVTAEVEGDEPELVGERRSRTASPSTGGSATSRG